MKKYIPALIILITLFSCKENQKVESPETIEVDTKELAYNDAELPIYNFDQFEPYLNKEDDQVYVVNFWATWCKPCVEELPHFEEVNKKFGDKNVKVVLVSLDMPKMIQGQLIPFLKKRNLSSEVIVLDDPKQNDWIPKVSEQWSGAIPATVIYNKDKRAFYEQTFSYDQLVTELNKFLN